MADDYFSGFGGGDKLREALRLAMAPNRLANGQVSTPDFAPPPTPPDEHGFLFSRVGGDLRFNPYEAVKNFMAYRAPPGALSTSGDDAPVRNAMDAAGWVGMSGLGLNAFGAVPANALGSAGAKAPQALAEALRTTSPPRVENPIRAYHGSPHDFDKFDLSKIGTGEGAQAYGHGAYLAESEAVAKQYRDKLAPKTSSEAAAQELAEAHGVNWNSLNAYDKLSYIEEADKLAVTTQKRPGGRMYEVAIHASPDQFLDWDKPLSQQSEAVRKAFEGVQQAPDIPGQLAYYRMAGDLTGKKSISSPEVATKLSEQGIPGIRYLDQGSRGAGQGTSNFVVFDPALIEILRKYGLLGPVAAGATANALMGDKDSQ